MLTSLTPIIHKLDNRLLVLQASTILGNMNILITESVARSRTHEQLRAEYEESEIGANRLAF